MHYKVLTSKVQKVSSSKLNKVQKTCYVKLNRPTLFSKTKRIVQNTICFLFLPFYFYFFYLLKKTPRMKCMNVMQCKSYKTQKKKKKQKTKKQNKNQRTMVTMGKALKHKDHVRKTQLVRVFCIQNLLRIPRALEFLFTLE